MAKGEGIPKHKKPEVALVTTGVDMDVLGLGYRLEKLLSQCIMLRGQKTENRALSTLSGQFSDELINPLRYVHAGDPNGINSQLQQHQTSCLKPPAPTYSP
jgi:hypothetical protein